MGSFISFDFEYPLDRDPKFLTGGFLLGEPTWKERHAKGVPVTHNLGEGMTWYQKSYGEFSFDNDHTGPFIKVGDTDYSDFSYQPVVRFCNFRYKSEWLEKHKKQTI